MNNALIVALISALGLVFVALVTGIFTLIGTRGTQQISAWKEWREDSKELRAEMAELKKQIAELEATVAGHAIADKLREEAQVAADKVNEAETKRLNWLIAEAGEREAALRIELINSRNECAALATAMNECLDLLNSHISGRPMSETKLREVIDGLRATGYIEPIKPRDEAPDGKIEQLTRDGRKPPRKIVPRMAVIETVPDAPKDESNHS